MATIQKRKYLNKTSYQVRIRRLGIKTITKSFMNKADANRWARSMEAKLDQGDYSDYSTASKVTLGDLFKRYINEDKHKKKKQWKNEEYRLRQLLITYKADWVSGKAYHSPLSTTFSSSLFLLDILVSRNLVLCYNCFDLKMKKKNYKKIPFYLFYLFTLFIIIDFGTILARPLFKGYPIPHFWNASFEMHPFSWAFAVITITICVLFIKARKF